MKILIKSKNDSTTIEEDIISENFLSNIKSEIHFVNNNLKEKNYIIIKTINFFLENIEKLGKLIVTKFQSHKLVDSYQIMNIIRKYSEFYQEFKQKENYLLKEKINFILN